MSNTVPTYSQSSHRPLSYHFLPQPLADLYYTISCDHYWSPSGLNFLIDGSSEGLNRLLGDFYKYMAFKQIEALQINLGMPSPCQQNTFSESYRRRSNVTQSDKKQLTDLFCNFLHL